MLSVATLIVAATLFLPLSLPVANETSLTWLAPVDRSAVLALGLAAAGFWALRKRFGCAGTDESRMLRNALALVVLHAILLRAAMELKNSHDALAWPWWPKEPWLWMPWFLPTGLAAMLLGSRLALLIGFSGILFLYLRANPGPLPLVGCLVASFWGIALVRRSNRWRVLKAGGGSGVLLGAVAVLHGIQANAPAIQVIAGAAAPVLVGFVSAFAVLAILPVMEWVLGELSDVTLAESGTDHPLLDQLKEQAPGTWHHTLNVADLAEKAATAIGARSLFCRTAALYHDVGKLKDPSIFAENITGPSPHDELDPRVSAQRIIEHVTYGVELARRHGLPKAFRDIIREHHGVSVVRFFYAKACAQLREGEDAESLRPAFSYPGPSPSSRESGIIALADVVEAATRAFHPKNEGEAQGYLRKLLADRVAEGELAKCPLTLAELATIESTFLDWLKARNHFRPPYPETGRPSAGDTSKWPEEKAAQPA